MTSARHRGEQPTCNLSHRAGENGGGLQQACSCCEASWYSRLRPSSARHRTSRFRCCPSHQDGLSRCLHQPTTTSTAAAPVSRGSGRHWAVLPGLGMAGQQRGGGRAVRSAGTHAMSGLSAAAALTPLESHLKVLKPALHHCGRKAVQHGLQWRWGGGGGTISAAGQRCCWAAPLAT